MKLFIDKLGAVGASDILSWRMINHMIFTTTS
jgi:hypothetical protein